MPAPSAESRNSTAEMISTARRPQRSARRPAKNAPNAQPSSIEATSKPVPGGTRMEGLLEPVDSAVDDAAVEAEQEAADGGDAADQDDEPGVLAAWPRSLAGWNAVHGNT